MKRNIIIIAALAAAVMLTGCGTTGTNSLDKAATEVQSDSAVSTASVSAEQTSSDESEKTDDSSIISDIKNSSAASATEDSKTVSSADENALTSEGYLAVENPPASSISVASLDGTWHCITSDASLWFTKGDDIYSGTWHDNMEEGDVKLEYSVDGSGEKAYWYNLYNNRGQHWYSIYATGEIPLNELVVKNVDSEDFHYIRETENAASDSESTDAEVSDSDFFEVTEPVQTSISVASLDGVWHCTTSDASLWFTKGDDIYSGTWHDNMEEGNVKLEYSVDGSSEKTYWYNLYNNRGQLWYSIYATGEIPFDELVVKNDDGEDFHYIRQDQ